MAKPNLPAVQSFSGDEIALLRNSYAKGLDDNQFKLFMMQAKAMDLNPFTREIYGMNVGGRLQLMTSINGLRKIAHSTGTYLGCKIVVQYDKERLPLSATAVVKKLVASRVCEFEYTAMVDEFSSRRDNWVKMPVVMISKVAEAQALRMAFPKVDQVQEEAEMHAAETMQPEDVVEVMPDYENESQEPPVLDTVPNFDAPGNVPVAAQATSINPTFAGDYVVRFGPYKKKPTKLKDIPKEKLEEQIKWAYTQEKLAPEIAEYVTQIERFLDGGQG